MKEYQKMFGIYENTHNKVEEVASNTVGRSFIAKIKFCFQLNEEFIMKYSDADQKTNWNTNIANMNFLSHIKR